MSPALDWEGVWVNVGLAFRNPDHQQIHYNFIHRVYFMPRKLYLMKKKERITFLFSGGEELDKIPNEVVVCSI